MRGQLYAIAEIKDEIRLLCLDPAKDGKVVWSQQLAMVEQGVIQDPVRRLAGVSPSYADGILICPTGSGCAVALDLATRSLLWGYVYPQGDQQGNGRRWRGNQNLAYAFATYLGPPPRWLDGTAMIVNGRVLLTPAEADTLYCLNLADGKPSWDPKPRADQSSDWYYIACVHQGKIVRVGRSTMDAVNLDDGKPAWEGRSVSFAPGNVTGHGFYAGNRYFVPLSTAEVAAVNLDSGKIVATAKSRKGAVPGNLVCYRGRIISQGLDGLEVYYQIDAARAESKRLLANDPGDVEGLTLRGEIALDEGRSTDAVADFRRAYLADAGSDRRAPHAGAAPRCAVERTARQFFRASLAGRRAWRSSWRSRRNGRPTIDTWRWACSGPANGSRRSTTVSSWSIWTTISGSWRTWTAPYLVRTRSLGPGATGRDSRRRRRRGGRRHRQGPQTAAGGGYDGYWR